MKKLLTVLLSLMMIFALVGCSSSKEDKPAVANDGSIEVVVVTAPVAQAPSDNANQAQNDDDEKKKSK